MVDEEPKPAPAGEIVSKGATIAHAYRSDEDEDIGDPFLRDSCGNLTNFRLSDLNNRLSDACCIEPMKAKKQSRAERLKWHNTMIEKYMKASLEKYNREENLGEDLCFKFVKCLKQSLIVEGLEWYRHFNFEAVQSNGSVLLFFAEVIPNSPDCEVTCCMPLRDDENGRCIGCHNQGDLDLKHPSNDSVYIGGHVDCPFPFLIDTESDSESDE